MEHKLEEGLRIRRSILGDDYVDKATQQARPSAERFQQLVSTYCWGELWGGDVLDRKTRSLVNVAMLAAMGRVPELRLHVRGAVVNGCSETEIAEALLHATVYAGVPAGVEGFRVLREVFEAIDGTAEDAD